MSKGDAHPPLSKPAWLKARLGGGAGYLRLKKLLHEKHLHTVCEEALCPNQGRCWAHGRATLILMGDVCTRSCAFCNIAAGRPQPLDESEPRRVAEAVHAMQLREVVLTSVTRDDVKDGGASLWAETVRQIRKLAPRVGIEILVPDFKGDVSALRAVLDSRPDVFSHNLETVPSLYPLVRKGADYARSLRVLRRAHQAGLVVKTAVMVGLGETDAGLLQVMEDARRAGVDIFYMGQYLQPTRRHAAVRRFVPPGGFEDFRQKGLAMGFPVVVAAPLIRSSSHSDAQQAFLRSRIPVRRRGARPRKSAAAPRRTLPPAGRNPHIPANG
jgi:lipoic acid synthetase